LLVAGSSNFNLGAVTGEILISPKDLSHVPLMVFVYGSQIKIILNLSKDMNTSVYGVGSNCGIFQGNIIEFSLGNLEIVCTLDKFRSGYLRK
jgi:hypothetical protein